MKIDVTVVDYGRGNLLSISRAQEHFGATLKFAEMLTDVKKAGRLVLPGV